MAPERKRLMMSRVVPARPAHAARAGEDYGLTAQPDWRGVDWRSHLRSATIGGRHVHYVDIGSGDGPPVVFIHGLSGCWQNWLENLPRFAQERRCIALDLPGFSRSEMPAEEITINGFARAVDELCEQLELGEVAVVGNSMGGFAGAELAISFPERVERLVLVAAAGISSVNLRREPVLAAARLLAGTTAAGAASAPAFVRRPRWRHALLALVARHPTRLALDLTVEMLHGAGSPGFLPALEALTNYDFRERLPEIRCPTLVIWGRNDALVPVADAKRFEELIPRSRRIVMDDTGHVPMLERPETFNTYLAEFLAEPAPAATDAATASTAA